MEIQDQLTVLKVSGADAFSFLQGQLTNDIQLAKEHWQFSAYCSPKGRAITIFSLWRTDDSAYLILDKSLSESVVKRLQMYVMRSKVIIEVLDEACCVAVFNAEESAKKTFSSIQHHDSYTELGFGKSSLRVYFDERADAPAGTRWAQSLISAGIPHISEATSEVFVPQMVNLDVLQGINFKKGCYTGQEIVARMHYLGKLKQRMYLMDIAKQDSDDLVKSNSLYAGEKLVNDEGKNVGTIVNYIEGMNSLLAVIRIEETGSIVSADGIKLERAGQQPYSISS